MDFTYNFYISYENYKAMIYYWKNCISSRMFNIFPTNCINLLTILFITELP